ncbi:MAG: hypothetical protein IT328_20215 [Caldilineaceae bacterium]|nr:hypothetical protein [Caldilineaceae bacterium]
MPDDLRSATGDHEVGAQRQFVTLSCPSCGGKLQITQDMDRFACGYCGNEHVVKRQGGVVMLAPVVEGLRRVQMGTDKTAAELAIIRLEKELGPAEETLRTFRSQNSYAKLGPPDSLIALFLVGAATFAAMTLCVAGGDANGMAFLWGALCVGCVVEWARRDSRRTAAGKKIYDARLAELQDKIEEIRRELERNRQLVRGQ